MIHNIGCELGCTKSHTYKEHLEDKDVEIQSLTAKCAELEKEVADQTYLYLERGKAMDSLRSQLAVAREQIKFLSLGLDMAVHLIKEITLEGAHAVPIQAKLDLLNDILAKQGIKSLEVKS